MSQAAPVQDRARVDAVDAARGFALLGIFCVNIALFAQPLGVAMAPKFEGAVPDVVAHYAVKIFAEYKFYGLFSILFGIGFALMRERAIAKGARWGWLYFRRLLMMAGMGFAHAMLLWYGDILFIYAFAALILLACGSFKARGLAIAGAIVLTLSTVWSTGMVGLQLMMAEQAKAVQAGAGTPDAGGSGAADVATKEQGAAGSEADKPVPPAAGVEPPAEAGPPAEGEVPAAVVEPDTKSSPPAGEFWNSAYGRLIWGMKHQQITDPTSEQWVALEREAYQNGPFLQVFLFRATMWVSMLVFAVIASGFGGSVVGLFLIGAALAKSNAFAPERVGLHRRLILIAVCVGLPLCAAGPLLVKQDPSTGRMILMTFCTGLGGPLMSMGYLAGITMLVNSGRAVWLTSRLMLTGRMALTNYLSQTVIATTLFYYYGFGLFGKVDRAGQLAIVFGVFAVQLFVISPLWMAKFRFGPVEWLWRSFTYLSWQPMARAAGRGQPGMNAE